MKKFILLLVLGLISSLSFGQWGKKIKGDGVTNSFVRNVGPYESISIGGFYDVNLISGEEGRITLKGEGNLIENLIVEVKNNELIIRTKNFIDLIPSRKSTIEITIPVKEIEGIKLSGSGSIASNFTLKSPKFSVALSGSGTIDTEIDATEINGALAGSGDVTLHVSSSSVKLLLTGSGSYQLDGKTDTVDVKVSGSGDVNTFDLNAKTADVIITGSSDVNVFASELLTVKISGSGDVRYKGSPKIDSKISGSGELIAN